MSKFDKKINRMMSHTDPDKIQEGIEYLTDVAGALRDAVAHYQDQEKLNNWNEHWYRNAKESYEKKLGEVDLMLIQLEAKRVSVQTKPVSNEV